MKDIKQMKQIILIRIAEYEFTDIHCWPNKDTNLSVDGHNQAAYLAKTLPEGITSVYSSTHTRAIKTAEPLAKKVITR